MRTSAHPDGKESLGAANDEKKKSCLPALFVFPFVLLTLSFLTMEQLSFFRQKMTKKPVLGSRGIPPLPSKCVGCKVIILQESVCVQANYTLHSLHYACA